MENFSELSIEEIAIKPYILKEGDLVPFIEAMVGYDEKFSQYIAISWIDRRVTINGISFQVNENHCYGF